MKGVEPRCNSLLKERGDSEEGGGEDDQQKGFWRLCFYLL